MEHFLWGRGIDTVIAILDFQLIDLAEKQKDFFMTARS